MNIPWWKNLWWLYTCEHPLLRGVYGDEINARNGARVACAGCSKTFGTLGLADLVREGGAA